METLEKSFLSTLSNDSRNYYLNNPIEKGLVFEYLNDNGFSNESMNLAEIAINNFLNYSEISYPGKDEGFQYRWWNDDNFIKNSGNFDMPSNTNVAVEQTPNVVELALFAIFPREAILHKLNADTAISESQTLVANNILTNLNNGKADAFRHAYWNALDNSDFDKSITKAFTDAHEAFSTGLPKEMDLFNNERGRDIGDNYNPFSDESIIALAVRAAITNGDLNYISPLGPNGQILSNSQIIPTNQ